MFVSVRFVGSLRNAAGKNKINVEFEKPAKLKEIVDKIVEKKPKLRRALIDVELGDPRVNALVLVNDKDVSVLDGLETVVKDGDEVVFVPVLHGG